MISALVIDDTRQTADSLCQMLSLLDVDAYVAYGPRAAIHSLNERIPDIIFLDINMPGVSGFEVLAYIRREPKFGNIPTVVVTSDDQKVTAQRARDEGAIDVVIKPATFEALESAIRSAGLIP